MLTQWWLLQLKLGRVKARTKAAERLGRLKKVRALNSLVAALDDRSSAFVEDRFWKVAPVAAWALGEIGDARAVKPLIKVLEDSSELREVAAQALGKIGTPAIDSLVAVLKDHKDYIRTPAAQALGFIRDARALSPLITTLNEKGEQYYSSRRAAAEALGAIGDPRAVETLIAYLRNPTNDVRHVVTLALGEIKDTRAVNALMMALNEKSIDHSYRVNEAAAKALGKIGGSEAAEVLLQRLSNTEDYTPEEVDSAIDEALIKIGPIAVEGLCVALTGHKIGRASRLRRIAKILGEIRDTRAIPSLIQALKNSDDDLRKMAEDAIVNIGAAATEYLLKELQTDHSIRIFRALVRTERERAKDLLVKAISDYDTGAQNEMIQILQAVDAVVFWKWKEAVTYGAAAVEPLLLAAQERHDSNDWEEIVTALAEVGDDRALNYLLHTLKHDSYQRWRIGAVKALGILGDPRAISDLLSFLKPGYFGYDGVVAEEAVEALKQIGGQEAEQAITEYRKIRPKN